MNFPENTLLSFYDILWGKILNFTAAEENWVGWGLKPSWESLVQQCWPEFDRSTSPTLPTLSWNTWSCPGAGRWGVAGSSWTGLEGRAPLATLGGRQNPCRAFFPGGQTPEQERELCTAIHQSVFVESRRSGQRWGGSLQRAGGPCVEEQHRGGPAGAGWEWAERANLWKALRNTELGGWKS